MKTKKLIKLLLAAGFEQTNECVYVYDDSISVAILNHIQPAKLTIETIDDYFDIEYKNMSKETFLSEISSIIGLYQDRIIDMQDTINTLKAIMQSSCK